MSIYAILLIMAVCFAVVTYMALDSDKTDKPEKSEEYEVTYNSKPKGEEPDD